MPQTQREWISQALPKQLPENLITAIVETEKLILERASAEHRTFPYDLRIMDAETEVASESVTDPNRRDAIINGQAIDAPTWKFTSHAQHGKFSNLTITLTSGISPLTLMVLLSTEDAGAKILEALTETPCITEADIAKKTGLSLRVVVREVLRLLSTIQIEECGIGSGKFRIPSHTMPATTAPRPQRRSG